MSKQNLYLIVGFEVGKMMKINLEGINIYHYLSKNSSMYDRESEKRRKVTEA